MDKVFWLREGLIAGRTGPNMDSWRVEDFKDNGFSAILSVNEGEMVHESLIRNLKINYANIPMSPNAPARQGDKELCLVNLPKAISFIGDNLSKGPILIHCRSGKDRTGMVMAASLMAIEGLGAKEAMDDVLDVRPIAFSAEGWIEFALDVLEEFETEHQSLEFHDGRLWP